MDKILEGDLARLELADVLVLLYTTDRTGVLVLERADQETKVFLRSGHPVFATSTRQDLRLGDVIVRLGKVAAGDLERVLAPPRPPGHRIGSVLLAHGLISEPDLASALKIQTSEAVFEALSWQAGVFTFWDRVPPPATAVTLDMELQSLLIEAARRRDDAHAADADPNAVVEALVPADHVKQSVTLTPDEWTVFFLANGRRTVGEVMQLAGLANARATQRVLRALLAARLLRLRVAPSPTGTPMLRRTQRLAENRESAGSPSVEFAAERITLRAEDDTKDIVTPNAVSYLAHARRVTVSHLVLVQDGGETSFPLTRDTYTMGRHPNNDIVIADPKVSSFHARLDRSGDGYTLLDLKSRNGSFVNSRRVESRLLKTGDEVRLGFARLQYKVDFTTPSS